MANELNLALMTADLKNARMYLLRLHKALLEYEKERYETVNGRINSTGEYYNLVLNDESFAWLRAMSGLIVEIDEALDKRAEPITEIKIIGLARQMISMTKLDAETDFSAKYDAGLQASPDAMFEHIKLTKELEKFRHEV